MRLCGGGTLALKRGTFDTTGGKWSFYAFLSDLKIERRVTRVYCEKGNDNFPLIESGNGSLILADGRSIVTPEGGINDGKKIVKQDGTRAAEVLIVKVHTVTYKVANGAWADGSTEKTENVTSGSKPASVPTDMEPAEGYSGGAWNVEDPAAETITADTTFTYTFQLITYPVWVNGVQVTYDNKDDVLGNNSGVTYDPDTKTLTFSEKTPLTEIYRDAVIYAG